MIYDSINGNSEGEHDPLDFYTIGRLIDLATEQRATIRSV